MGKVAIIDYDMGNLLSVERACKSVGMEVVITHQENEIKEAAGIILPGVGAFGDAIAHLNELGLADLLKSEIASGKPFLGICLGMQLLMESSEEFGNHEGLGVFKGKVKRFNSTEGDGAKVRIPQINWNTIQFNNDDIFKGLNQDEFVYFLHSFYVEPEEDENILCKTNYGGIEYCSGLKKDNIFALQFHPEKSGKQGLTILENFKSIL